MKPWCAEGEVPTAANLNPHRGWNSCVGWHRDDEPMFGECGEAKLIVSVSFGDAAVFRWRRQSCPNDEGHLSCLGHGDILVKDGQCQDEFLIVRILAGNKNGSTLRSGVSNNMFPPVLCSRQEWHVVCQRMRRVYPFLLWRILGMAFFGLFGFSSWCLGSASFASLPVVHKTWVTSVRLLLDTPFRRRSVGALPL